MNGARLLQTQIFGPETISGNLFRSPLGPQKKKEENASHHLLNSEAHSVEQLCPKAPQKATLEDHKKASRMKFYELFENLEFLIFVSLSSGLVTSGCSLNVLNLILNSL